MRNSLKLIGEGKSTGLQIDLAQIKMHAVAIRLEWCQAAGISCSTKHEADRYMYQVTNQHECILPEKPSASDANRSRAW